MLNQNIKTLRKQRGYTQETFAQELNVVRQTVSKWEKGTSVPDALMLEKIAELFEVPVGELLGETGDEAIKAEEKPDLKQISEQLSLLNNQFARELARKKRNRKIALIVLGALLALLAVLAVIAMIPHSRPVPTDPVYSVDEGSGQRVARYLNSALDRAVTEAILAKHPVDTQLGECPTESHYVYGTDENNDTVTVYLLEDYRLFGFHNGFFTDVSGGVTPVVLTFRANEAGYQLTSRQEAQDGSRYTDSIKALFPRRYVKKILRGLEQLEEAGLWSNQVRQAQAYLQAIHRDATICRYHDMKIELLGKYGVSTEASNKIDEMRLGYDYTVGNHELIENGVRVVYQTEVDEQNDRVTFTKFKYDTKEIIEFIAVDAETGGVIPDAPQPEKVKYYMGDRGFDAAPFTTAAYVS